MVRERGTGTPGSSDALSAAPGAWAEFWRTPVVMRLYLLLVAGLAVGVPLLHDVTVESPHAPEWLTVTALVAVSVLNVEVSRWLTGGLARTHQPHKALSAWAFASALLLPPIWLLVVVPVTYTHARWRGIRVTLWKWIGSGFYLVLCGLAAGAVREVLMGTEDSWTHGDGSHGFVTMLAAGAVFLALETLLFTGSSRLNHAEDEVWLREMLRSPSYYATEAGVLLVGGLYTAVWAAGFWFTLLFIPIYVLIQHAVLLAPLRERAAAVEAVATKNRELAQMNDELEQANRFKADLVSMLGHEIGNPLTSVLGYAQVGGEAAEAGDAGTARTALGVVERNARQMAAVLADIVHLVATDRGALVAVPEPVGLARHLELAAAEWGDGTRPLVDCPGDLVVLVQPGHLDQILANLLSNAEKYADGATALVARAAPDGVVELAVTDAGPGVPEAFLAHLFQRFRRDPETAQRVGGTGIGLFISRELARANGGDLLHRDGDGTGAAGSRFVVRLLGGPA